MTQHDGHLLVEVEGHRYLLDTGSPWSLGSAPVSLAGREFPMRPSDLMGNTAASLAELVGTPFDGLLGTDVLAELDLEISLRDGTIAVSEAFVAMPDGLPVKSVHGVPLVECGVGGEMVWMFVDTGAPLSYLAEDRLLEAPEVGEVEDFHPLLGRYSVPTHAVELGAWGHVLSIRVGQMPLLLDAALRLAGAEGILGTEILQHGVLQLSLRQKRAEFILH
jgi:hypothetical protein